MASDGIDTAQFGLVLFAFFNRTSLVDTWTAKCNLVSSFYRKQNWARSLHFSGRRPDLSTFHFVLIMSKRAPFEYKTLKRLITV